MGRVVVRKGTSESSSPQRGRVDRRLRLKRCFKTGTSTSETQTVLNKIPETLKSKDVLPSSFRFLLRIGLPLRRICLLLRIQGSSTFLRLLQFLGLGTVHPERLNVVLSRSWWDEVQGVRRRMCPKLSSPFTFPRPSPTTTLHTSSFLGIHFVSTRLWKQGLSLSYISQVRGKNKLLPTLPRVPLSRILHRHRNDKY